MFKNSNRNNDAEVGHMRSGRIFREFPLVNLFEQNHEPLQEEGFYSGEQEELLIEEHLGSAGPEEEKTTKPRWEESKTSGTGKNVEVSTITPPVVVVALSNQSSQSHQSTQSYVTSSSAHTQSGNLARSMADEMRLPIFRGDGSEDTDHH
jgi:hypothetical protein